MDIEELRKQLRKLKVPQSLYFLGGYGNTDQKYCIEQENGEWLVYYSERGSKFRLKKHNSENEACNDLYERLITLIYNYRPLP